MIAGASAEASDQLRRKSKERQKEGIKNEEMRIRRPSIASKSSRILR